MAFSQPVRGRAHDPFFIIHAKFSIVIRFHIALFHCEFKSPIQYEKIICFIWKLYHSDRKSTKQWYMLLQYIGGISIAIAPDLQ